MYALLGFGRNTTIWKSGIWVCKVFFFFLLNSYFFFEKIASKVVQIKFLTMHITNKKLSFDIYVGNTQNIFMEHEYFTYIVMIFGIK